MVGLDENNWYIARWQAYGHKLDGLVLFVQGRISELTKRIRDLPGIIDKKKKELRELDGEDRRAEIPEFNVLCSEEGIDKEKINSLDGLSAEPFFCEIKSDQGEYYLTRVPGQSLPEQNIYSYLSPIAKLRFKQPGESVLVKSNTHRIKEQNQFDISKAELKKWSHSSMIESFIYDGKQKIKKGSASASEKSILVEKFEQERKDSDWHTNSDLAEVMEAEQDFVMRADYEGLTLITGPAGSGKTNIALHRLMFLIYEYPNIFKSDKIMVFCGNPPLQKLMEHVLAVTHRKTDIKVRTIQEWLYEQCNIRGVIKTDPQAFNKATKETAMNCRAFIKARREQYLDEARTKLQELFINKPPEKIIDRIVDRIEETKKHILNSSIPKISGLFAKVESVSKDINRLQNLNLIDSNNELSQHILHMVNINTEVLINEWIGSTVWEAVKRKDFLNLFENNSIHSDKDGGIVHVQGGGGLGSMGVLLEKAKDLVLLLNSHKNIDARTLSTFNRLIKELNRFSGLISKNNKEKVNILKKSGGIVSKLFGNNRTISKIALLEQQEKELLKNAVDVFSEIITIEYRINKTEQSHGSLMKAIDELVDQNRYLADIMNWKYSRDIIESVSRSNSSIVNIISELRSLIDKTDLFSEKSIGLILDQVRDIFHRLFYNSNHLHSAQSLLEDFYNKFLSQSRVEEITDADGQVLAMMMALMGDLPIQSDNLRPFDHILIDEAQDISPLQMHILWLLSKNSMTLAGDIAQSASVTGIRGSWQNIGLTPARTVKLTNSHRSTVEIIKFARSMIASLGIDVADKISGVHGDKPALTSYPSAADLVGGIFSKLKNLRTVYPEETVLIVCPQIAQAQWIVDYLNQHDDKQPAYFVERDHNWDFKQFIHVTTYDQIRGLEFDNVIAVKISDIEQNEKALETIYVALTRARNRLLIFDTEKPQFLDKIDSKLYDTIQLNHN